LTSRHALADVAERGRAAQLSRGGADLGVPMDPPGRGRIKRMRDHSRFVSLMKVALPVLALILVTLIFVWPKLQASDNRFQVGFAAIKAHEAGNPSMMNPRYVGLDDREQPFTVTADLARNVIQTDRPVELEVPKADLSLSDGSWVVLTAQTGLYEREKRQLDLEGEVNLFHDSGYEFKTASARIDLATGTAHGTVPVTGHGPFGDLRAEGFHLDKGRRVINFTGRARVIMYGGAGE
jgi:lipopolysaccharide export system protein LptC